MTVLGKFVINYRKYLSHWELLTSKALIRSHLDNGNSIWDPHYQMNKFAVEKVQCWATKLVSHLKHLSYEQWLVALRLPSLLFRKRWADMIQVYKIMNGIDRLDPRAFFNRALNEPARGHSRRLFVGRCQLKLRKKLIQPASDSELELIIRSCCHSHYPKFF